MLKLSIILVVLLISQVYGASKVMTVKLDSATVDAVSDKCTFNFKFNVSVTAAGDEKALQLNLVSDPVTGLPKADQKVSDKSPIKVTDTLYTFELSAKTAVGQFTKYQLYNNKTVMELDTGLKFPNLTCNKATPTPTKPAEVSETPEPTSGSVSSFNLSLFVSTMLVGISMIFVL
ncbi:hypothetical protein DLAC_10124 [Tieghemostelium lacteum]|uniref:Uncharacterized protein n=1 Tax=Tieghemostelium lacteum TaxID=361077 RepID=A0A151Z682_TIELA|nr:hypothetical protein DLAC_10124 [Tieghemostelium lacteum]|eukprot:KYQ89455.1 hypothetical protein DLAC_10124 [Tieghemostelium lacteum]